MTLTRADITEPRARPQAWSAARERAGRPVEPAAASSTKPERFTIDPEIPAARGDSGTQPSPRNDHEARAADRPPQSPRSDRGGRTDRTAAKASAAGTPQTRARDPRSDSATAEAGDTEVRSTGEAPSDDEKTDAATTVGSIETTDVSQSAPAASVILPSPLQGPPVSSAQTTAASGTGTSQDDTTEGSVIDTSSGSAQIGKSAGPTGASGKTKAGFEASLADINVGAAAGGAPVAADTPLPSMATQTASPLANAADTTPSPAISAPAPPPPVPIGAVPMTIGLRALGAASRFDIRLDPVELGRIDVSLDIDKDRGTVGARVVVDRPETLALLQRDASSLQQALAQTGLDASAGVALSLRDSGGEGRRQGESGAQPRSAGRDDASEGQTSVTMIDAVPLRSMRGSSSVDIRI